VLLELRIENLLLIDRAELRPGELLNAITGETGAGKTVLAHALDLLLGGKPRSGIVRPGAEEAYVEGVFEDGDEEVVLARRVSAEGRTRAYVNHRSSTAGDLRDLGGRLVSFFGQHEHRKLTLGAAQLELLDGFADAGALREEVAAAHARVRQAEHDLEELSGRAGTRDRDLGLLAFEIQEIEDLDPSEEEESSLEAERGRLRQVDGLRAAAAAGGQAIAPDDGPGAAALLAEAERLADGVAGADAELDGLAERMRGLRIEAEDLGAELRRYLEGLDADPERLHVVDERLDGYERLKRKHGGSVAAVLEHAERCRADRDRLENAEVALDQARAALDAAVAERAAKAQKLTAARSKAAPKMAKRVLAELDSLAMEGASFSVELEPRDEIGPSGAERVEFMLAPNAGVAAAPVRDGASGGELSRVMLALMTVAGAGGSSTLVFDEVDSGVGGQTARAVGERLRALGSERQVLCITHLPQIAALAERHFRIEKLTGGDVTRAKVERLEDAGVVEELCRMLGADSGDAGARRHAEDLLAAA
jgi:DNA repair protein RecN (Recombination protein N)